MPRSLCWLVPGFAVALSAAQTARTPEPPAQPSAELVIQVGTLHPVSGPAIADGVLVVGGGRILAVGARGTLTVPGGVTTLSLPTAHAYPGLIDACSTAFVPAGGFGEGSAGLETLVGLDRTANGEALARAGITTVHVAPATTGRWLGIGALVRPQAKGFVPFSAEARGAVFLRLTSAAGQHAVARNKDLRDLVRPFEEAEAYVKSLAKHRDAVAKYDKEWQAYLEGLKKAGAKPAAEAGEGKGDAPAGGETNPQPEASATAGAAKDASKRPTYPKAPAPDVSKATLQRVANGEQRLFIEAQRRDEILAALGLLRDRNLRTASLLGVLQASAALDELAQAGATVVVTPTGLPMELDGDVIDDSRVADLHRHGIAFAIASGDAQRARALSLLAATCVGQGVPEDVAVRAITLTPAELLGIAAHTGSLDRGKRADIVITSAPLLRSDARVLRVLADGATIFQGR